MIYQEFDNQYRYLGVREEVQASEELIAKLKSNQEILRLEK